MNMKISQDAYKDQTKQENCIVYTGRGVMLWMPEGPPKEKREKTSESNLKQVTFTVKGMLSPLIIHKFGLKR